ncbi:hypothetical protein ADIS_4082 [Lunatimonas lonarensis]|uniref:Uncharacterized protein n=1 Tax=Lunatimonas lonarensis TaxID=1232681 RepID=R7ZMR1_9BACT|nr:hypothetical protein ADIS_4082 [Lunatimonas lonarensis]
MTFVIREKNEIKFRFFGSRQDFFQNTPAIMGPIGMGMEGTLETWQWDDSLRCTVLLRELLKLPLNPGIDYPFVPEGLCQEKCKETNSNQEKPF